MLSGQASHSDIAQDFKTEDLQGLSAGELVVVAQRMLVRIGQQSQRLAEQSQAITARDKEIKFKNAKLERITFELARLKAWKFAAKTEAMNAEQRQLFEETVAADEASLQAQLDALRDGLQEQTPSPQAASAEVRRQPKRQALPEHLPRVEHHHEPANTQCPTPECGRPLERVGEDISERLDIVPAQFIVQRHIRGKWACRCCQILVQEPVAPQIIDSGVPTAALIAHTMVSHFVDHLPYYRLQSINARSNVHTPRSTLAAWSGRGGAAIQPLLDVHKEFVLGSQVLHVDETPVNMLDPGAGKTKKTYIWAYARGGFDDKPGVVYDFCLGRGAKYPLAFLEGWTGTLVRDEFKSYDSVLKLPDRTAAGCLAHARRKFDELIKINQSPVAQEAVQRIAQLYRIESMARELSPQDRLVMRQKMSAPLWAELHVWLQLERTRVPDGSAIAGAIDYSLNHWVALTANLGDGHVPIDNNHVENLMRPWAMGRKAWLFAGSELAGQRAAAVMSLLQSAKLHGIDPWAYLKDVLERLPTHMNTRIEELLPHRWQARG
jgi:transposase